MSRQEIMNTITNMFALMTSAEHIEESSELIDDLGISSMDILTLMSYIEEEFHIQITERSIRKILTVGDIVDLVVKECK